ncbi:response regulator [uncultured Bradyrhizobium sp.]|uniref:response regulator n=1 Tax=uncultured Bradyrhizobium sp. TaxID=199684 RepID=UPI0035C97A6C
MKIIRVAVADDHPIVLAGLSMLIRAEADLQIIGEAASGPEALQLICDSMPDIAVIDIALPHMNGILLARQLSADCPSVRVIVLTQYEDRAHLSQALDAGARGYVLKKSAAQCLVNAIRGVLVGGLYVDPAMAAHVFPPSHSKPAGKLSSSLTPRESEVLKLVAAGLTAKEIAGQLDLSLSSIETYKTRAADKLSIKGRAEIVRYASAQGWLASV